MRVERFKSFHIIPLLKTLLFFFLTKEAHKGEFIQPLWNIFIYLFFYF